MSFRRLRWALFLFGDLLVLAGCAIFDWVYPQPANFAVGFGLIVSGVFWIGCGVAVFSRQETPP